MIRLGQHRRMPRTSWVGPAGRDWGSAIGLVLFMIAAFTLAKPASDFLRSIQGVGLVVTQK
jgi:hypothetical protein